MKSWIVMAPMLALTGLGGCATYAPSDLKPGDSLADVQRELGRPTSRHVLPQGGVRLEFARGPFGKHTYMVDLDAQGRVLEWHQVLTEARFAEVRAGMPRDELLRLLGRPSDRRGGGWQPGEVWAYRYETPFCQWYQVSLDEQGVVRDSAYGPDPMCDVKDARE